MMKSSAAPSANLSHQLAEVRARIADLNRQLSSAHDARVPQKVAVERLDAWLDTLAQRQHEKGLAVEFTFREQGSVSLFSPLFLDEQVESMFAWATGKLLRDRLIAELDALYATLPKGGALDVESRAQSETSLTAKLFDFEVEEERLIVAAEQAGMTLNRRPGANPAAILAA
jgi:hypothetical protein